MSDPFGTKSQKKAAAAQEEATELARKRDNLASARRRRETVRQARSASAEAFQSSSAQGVINSSAAQGGLGSIKSQFTSNLSFLDNQNLITDQQSAAIGRQRKYQQKADAARRRFSTVLKVGGFAAGFT